VDNPTAAYDHFAKLLSEQLPCRIEVRIANSIKDENEDLRNNRIDFGQFRSTGYVLAHDAGLADAVATRSSDDGRTPFTSTASIVVKTSSGISSVARLRGKTFAYSDYASDTGLLFPEYALVQAGIDSQTGIVPVYSMHHVDSFKFLKEGKVQAAEVNDAIESANAKDPSYSAGEYITLWKSEPIPYNPIAVRSSLSRPAKQAIVNALLNLDTKRIPAPDGWFWKPALVPVDDSAYNVFRRAMRATGFGRDTLPGNFP
jgi:phosphonate transport system substrate-binding protein